jgi:hypothetical protein
MEYWPSPEAVPREDMRIPLERPSDVERIDLIVWRAREAGLSVLTLVVPDRAPASSITAAVAGARRHRSGRAPRVLVALEARVVGEDGRLSLAALPPGVDRLYATVDRLPNGGSSRTPLELREAFEEGRTSALEIVQKTIDALRAAVRRNPGVVLSRPFALLTAAGIPEDWVGDTALEGLVWDAVAGRASLQVDEWERTPRAGVVEVFAGAGVPVLFGTGTRDTAGVGTYDYVRRLLRHVPGLALQVAARSSAPADARVAIEA